VTLGAVHDAQTPTNREPKGSTEKERKISGEEKRGGDTLLMYENIEETRHGKQS
jgi:hypothetical protein